MGQRRVCQLEAVRRAKFFFLDRACLCGNGIQRHRREVVQDRGSRDRPDQRLGSHRAGGTWPHLVFYRKLDEGRKVSDVDVDVDNRLFLVRRPIARCEEYFFY